MAIYKNYIIKYGDTIDTIAQQYLGSSVKATQLISINRLRYPYIVEKTPDKYGPIKTSSPLLNDLSINSTSMNISDYVSTNMLNPLVITPKSLLYIRTNEDNGSFTEDTLVIDTYYPRAQVGIDAGTVTFDVPTISSPTQSAETLELLSTTSYCTLTGSISSTTIQGQYLLDVTSISSGYLAIGMSLQGTSSSGNTLLFTVIGNKHNNSSVYTLTGTGSIGTYLLADGTPTSVTNTDQKVFAQGANSVYHKNIFIDNTNSWLYVQCRDTALVNNNPYHYIQIYSLRANPNAPPLIATQGLGLIYTTRDKPNYALHPFLPIVYLFDNSGKLYAYSISNINGSLSLISTITPSRLGPQNSLSITPNGKYLYAWGSSDGEYVCCTLNVSTGIFIGSTTQILTGSPSVPIVFNAPPVSNSTSTVLYGQCVTNTYCLSAYSIGSSGLLTLISFVPFPAGSAAAYKIIYSSKYNALFASTLTKVHVYNIDVATGNIGSLAFSMNKATNSQYAGITLDEIRNLLFIPNNIDNNHIFDIYTINLLDLSLTLLASPTSAWPNSVDTFIVSAVLNTTLLTYYVIGSNQFTWDYEYLYTYKYYVSSPLSISSSTFSASIPTTSGLMSRAYHVQYSYISHDITNETAASPYNIDSMTGMAMPFSVQKYNSIPQLLVFTPPEEWPSGATGINIYAGMHDPSMTTMSLTDIKYQATLYSPSELYVEPVSMITTSGNGAPNGNTAYIGTSVTYPKGTMFYIYENPDQFDTQVLKPGDTMLLPLPSGQSSGAIVSGRRSAKFHSALGADISLNANGFFQIDGEGRGDFLVVEGISNVKQSLLARLSTKVASFNTRPSFGNRTMSLIGSKYNMTFLGEIKAELAETLRSEQRVYAVHDFAVYYDSRTSAVIVKNLNVEILHDGQSSSIVTFDPIALPI